ncbi:MAG TPA: hypothetical protein VFC18_20835 [Burkholderiales bacterium]|nr:hypothetical protein [Burkholderiales bacterium]
MPIASLRWRLDAETLRDVPESPGVFTLWSASDLVYIGRTDGNATLRDRLRSVLHAGVAVSHFTWEVTVTPRTRAGDLLNAYLEKNGRLPRYNEHAPEGSVLRSQGWQTSGNSR